MVAEAPPRHGRSVVMRIQNYLVLGFGPYIDRGFQVMQRGGFAPTSGAATPEP